MVKKRMLLMSGFLAVALMGLSLLGSECFGGGEGGQEEPVEPEKQVSDGETPALPGWLTETSQDDDGSGADDEFDINPLSKLPAAILVVVVLGCAAFYFQRKFMPKFVARGGKHVSVVETVHLGQHKAVHLLDVGGGRRLLIGSTNGSINILADVTAATGSEAEEAL